MHNNLQVDGSNKDEQDELRIDARLQGYIPGRCVQLSVRQDAYPGHGWDLAGI